MRVAAFQAPLLQAGSMDAIGLIRTRVAQCEAQSVEVLCCPEGILGGLAKYSLLRLSLQFPRSRDGSSPCFHPSPTVPSPRLLDSQNLAMKGGTTTPAAVFQRGSVVGVYRKLHPAIRRSVYSEGFAAPVFQIGNRMFGIVICNDSNYPKPVRQMTALGATVLFIPTNNGIPADRDRVKIATQTRNVDITLAVENNLWVVRADVAGKADGLVSHGSSAIVGPGDCVLKSAQPMAEDFIVRNIR